MGRASWTTAVIGSLVLASGLPFAHEPASADASGEKLAETGGPARVRGFVENRGQIEDRIRLYGSIDASRVFFERDGVVVVLPGGSHDPGPAATLRKRSREPRSGDGAGGWALRLTFDTGRAAARVEGQEALGPRLRFIGGEGHASSESSLFGQVVYRDVRPGVDLVFREGPGTLRYTILRRAGADRRKIGFRYQGIVGRTPTARGLVLETGAGRVVHSALPGSESGEFLLEPRPARPEDRIRSVRSAGESVAWSGFLGGARDEEVYAIAVGSDGCPVVAGATRSLQFPTTIGALDATYGGSFDAFVAKLSADGSSLLWSTFLGGANDDRAWAIRLDASDRPIVAGVTASPGFPTTPGAYDPTPNGSYDAFVTLLAADGSTLVWSTLLGGSAEEWDVSGLAVSASGAVAVSGSTRSADFPTTAGAFDASLGGVEDAFVAVLEPGAGALRFSTYLGGADGDVAEDVVLDELERPIVTGHTYSSDFPVTPGALETLFAGDGSLEDGFVTRLSASGDALEFSTYLGGQADDRAYAVALGPDGTIFVGGATESPDFPTTASALEPLPPGSEDAFLARLSADGSTLVAGTYFGGASLDRVLDLAVGPSGNPAFVGWSCSDTLPVSDGSSFGGLCDAYAAILSGDLRTLVLATYLGGDDDESAFALALDASERVFLGGGTRSGDFPTTSGVYDSSHASPYAWDDAFVVALQSLPAFCVSVSGEDVPFLEIAKAGEAPCAGGGPSAQAIDVIQGELRRLSAADIGPVVRIACDTTNPVLRSDAVPGAGAGYFYLARYGSGSYRDGDGPGLVGLRTPSSGDCP